jgi:CBS domain-containing protein
MKDGHDKGDHEMDIFDFCHTNVVTAKPDASIVEVAKLMRDRHVGDVVIVEKRDDKDMPIGIVTDRDLVVELLASEMDPGKVVIEDLMTRSVVSVPQSATVRKAVEEMSQHGVRRIVVLGDDDQLVGIFTIDDVVSSYSAGMGELAHLLDRELTQERHRRTSHREVMSA